VHKIFVDIIQFVCSSAKLARGDCSFIGFYNGSYQEDVKLFW